MLNHADTNIHIRFPETTLIKFLRERKRAVLSSCSALFVVCSRCVYQHIVCCIGMGSQGDIIKTISCKYIQSVGADRDCPWFIVINKGLTTTMALIWLFWWPVGHIDPYWDFAVFIFVLRSNYSSNSGVKVLTYTKKWYGRYVAKCMAIIMLLFIAGWSIYLLMCDKPLSSSFNVSPEILFPLQAMYTKGELARANSGYRRKWTWLIIIDALAK